MFCFSLAIAQRSDVTPHTLMSLEDALDCNTTTSGAMCDAGEDESAVAVGGGGAGAVNAVATAAAAKSSAMMSSSSTSGSGGGEEPSKKAASKRLKTGRVGQRKADDS